MSQQPSGPPATATPPGSPWQPGGQPRPFGNSPFLRRRAPLAVAAAAALWRRLMVRTRFIAVTGSYGKSTSTKCLAAILDSRFPINWSASTNNARSALAQSLLRTRFRHRFAVIEVGTKQPGALHRASLQIDPDIAVVLAVGYQHTNHFPNLDAMAREKASLLRGIGRRRIAVLNGDDPYVRAMADKCKGRVFLFGRSPEYDVWASNVSSCWPGRLRFTAHAGSQSVEIETQLAGEHWLPAVLGAICCAVAAGVPLEACAAPLRTVEPALGRLSVHPLPSGVTVIRDEHNASMSVVRPALDVLRAVRTGRRVVVMGDVFDTPLNRRDRFTELGRLAAESADIAVFIGQKTNVPVAAAVEAGMTEGLARSFKRIEDAAEWLRSVLQPGDVVLVRARGEFHMERIYFGLLGTAGCRLSRCSIHQPCDFCEHLHFSMDLIPPSAIKAATE